MIDSLKEVRVYVAIPNRTESIRSVGGALEGRFTLNLSLSGVVGETLARACSQAIVSDQSLAETIALVENFPY